MFEYVDIDNFPTDTNNPALNNAFYMKISMSVENHAQIRLNNDGETVPISYQIQSVYVSVSNIRNDEQLNMNL